MLLLKLSVLYFVVATTDLACGAKRFKKHRDFSMQNLNTNDFSSKFGRKSRLFDCYGSTDEASISYKVSGCSGIIRRQIFCCQNDKTYVSKRDCVDVMYEESEQLCDDSQKPEDPDDEEESEEQGDGEEGGEEDETEEDDGENSDDPENDEEGSGDVEEGDDKTEEDEDDKTEEDEDDKTEEEEDDKTEEDEDEQNDEDDDDQDVNENKDGNDDNESEDDGDDHNVSNNEDDENNQEADDNTQEPELRDNLIQRSQVKGTQREKTLNLDQKEKKKVSKK